MKRRLDWRRVDRDELATYLHTVEVLHAEAIGTASLYRCRDDRGESIAIALPGAEGLLIETHSERPPGLERRRRAGESDAGD